MTKSAKLLIAGQAGALVLSLLAATNFAPANAAIAPSGAIVKATTDEPVTEVTPDPSPSPSLEAPKRSVNVKKVFSSRSRGAINQARELAPQNYRGYFRTSKYAKWYTARHFKHKYGWGANQFKCVVQLWQKESSWRPASAMPGNSFLGIPQLSKQIVVASGYTVAEFRASTELQIQLGAKYIKYRKGYGSPCKAWKHFQRKSWY